MGGESLRRAAGGVLLALPVLLAVHAYTLLLVPVPVRGAARVVEIPPGTSLAGVGSLLERSGLIPSASAWVAAARLTAFRGRVKAGEYRLEAGLSPWEILERLRRGRVLLHRLTVPEGLRVKDVAELAAERLGLSASRITTLASDPAFLASLGVDAPSLEGYLFPETYSFPKGVREEDVLGAMVRAMLSFLDPSRRAMARRRGLSVHQLLTLASIVEKETARPEEAPLVASVYLNRLARGMRLQSDPTVIYGVPHFDGNLRRSDLRRDTPYNTYTRAGLPPTPIANPGAAAIEAVLHAPETDYLYFVSRNDGTHLFSRTLTEHNRAVNRYQRRRRGGNARNSS